MSIIEAQGLTKLLGGRPVVQELGFSLGPGRAFGLLGPNGAGKTTTVRLLTGLLRPDAGRVELFGEPLDAERAARLRARVGVQTDTSLYQTLSVRENLRIWGDLFGLAPARREARIGMLLEGFGLAARARSRAGELSKGMRQKLALARAMLHEPELLFLDEPTAGLDPEAAEDLIGRLRGLIAESGTSVVLCTHQLHGLETLCDEIGVLVAGRMIAHGPVQRLVAEHWPGSRLRLEVAPGDGAAARRLLGAEPGFSLDAVPVAPGAEPADAFEAVASGSDALDRAVAALVAAGVRIRHLAPVRRGIHELYFALVEGQRALPPNGTAATEDPR